MLIMAVCVAQNKEENYVVSSWIRVSREITNTYGNGIYPVVLHCKSDNQRYF